MLKGHFLPLATFLLATVICPFFLPLAMLFGYPWLIVIGVVQGRRWYAGHLQKPAQVTAVWVAYLGLILILHGIAICFDTPLKGAPPTEEEKRLGTGLSYLGGVVSTVSVVVAYVLDLLRPSVRGIKGKAAPLDDLLA